MWGEAAGSVFWALFLVLFPVAFTVQLSSPPCVTYKHTGICGLKGSSVEFPCSYPRNHQVISISGWSKLLHPDKKPKSLKVMPDYSFRMKYFQHGNNDCTMTLTDLRQTDTSIYYFIYSFRNGSGHHMTCNGVPGVSLHIYASPVSILVEKFVKGQNVPAVDWTVMEGQGIRMTCALICAANMNSTPGYIWYKNRRQLSSNLNSPFLSLDPISYKDIGSYVCILTGYEDLPSFAVNLTVRRKFDNVVSEEIPDGGLKMIIVPTRGYDAQNSTGQNYNNYQIHTDKSMSKLFTMIVVSICVGLVIVIMVAILILTVKRKKKKKKERRHCAGSVPGPPGPNSDYYMALHIKPIPAEYGTLDTTVYENLCQPQTSMG